MRASHRTWVQSNDASVIDARVMFEGLRLLSIQGDPRLKDTRVLLGLSSPCSDIPRSNAERAAFAPRRQSQATRSKILLHLISDFSCQRFAEDPNLRTT